MFASANSGPFASFSGAASFDTFLQLLGHGLRFTTIEEKDSTVALNSLIFVPRGSFEVHTFLILLQTIQPEAFLTLKSC